MFLCLVLISTIVPLSYADLPIHCLRSQILGRWKWELAASSRNSHISCGHPDHDSNLAELTNANLYPFVSLSSLDLSLTYPNHVVNLNNGDTGNFTMVFDEAIEIRISGQVIFAKFKYQLKGHDVSNGYLPPVTDLQSYESFCSETSIGWYHDDMNQYWGCVRGKQYQPEPKPQIKSHTSILVTKTNFFDDDSHKIQYQPDLALIEAVNSDPNSLWKAGINEIFLGESLYNISRMLGRRRYNKPSLFRSRRRVWADSDLDLPDFVDWRYIDSPIRNQGQCGSCYVFSTLAMLETRTRIANPDRDSADLHFSEQDILACSRYNEGCEGGYPYLVAKYAHEFGLINFEENQYIGADSQCPGFGGYQQRMVSSSRYHYVGGYFGACHETAMMEEIALYGPIVAAIQVPSSLMLYKSGIFTDCPKRVKDDDGYEQSDHAIVVVGYGQENGVKYWIVRNSWSDEWGENGYFRLLRGEDACGIESAAVTTYV